MYPVLKVAAILAAATILAGCEDLGFSDPKPIAPAPQQPQQARADYMRDLALQADSTTQNTSAVESALVWSRKCSELSQTVVQIQQEKHELEKDNHKLMAQVAKLQDQLTQTQTELGDANAMLVQMREEIENWKSNVLGFRKEMRQAQTAQINALKKVLELLGGEPVPVIAAPEPTTQPATDTTATTRKPNGETNS